MTKILIKHILKKIALGPNYSIAIGLSLLLNVGFVSGAARYDQIIRVNNTEYQVAIVDTPAKRRQGLMNVKHLAADSGMLFIYKATSDHQIWMKHTLIPLIVIWIDKDFEIVDIQRLEPCKSSFNCESFSSVKPSKFILELSDNHHPIKIGDRVVGIEKFIISQE